MKLSIFIILFTTITTFAQTVNITDANFKNALLHTDCVDSNLDGFGEFDADTNNDGEIQESEALAIEGLVLFNENIHSLKGIEAFPNLKYLLCNTNKIDTLDLSNNTQLLHLNCGDNQLSNLDVSMLENLEELKCFANNITSLDVSNNIALSYFNCSSNKLSNLDIQSNTHLSWLICSDNTDLNHLDISSTPSLNSLYCVGNHMTRLDLSKNLHLTSLRCEDNQLSYLNLSNGNNTNLYRMFAFSNPNLDCIIVDDENATLPNCSIDDDFDGWCKDDFASYSNSCTVNVNDFDVTHLQIYPNPVQNSLEIKTNFDVKSIQIFSLQGQLLDSNVNHKSIYISQLESGIYLLEMEINGQRVYKKFIKK